MFYYEIVLEKGINSLFKDCTISCLLLKLEKKIIYYN